MSKGDQTRQRIIAQAAPLFNQRGYAGCSIQDVLEATGLEKGGLYRHFASKEDLAAASFEYALTLTVKTRTDDLGHISGALPRLRFVVQRFIETPSVLPGGCPLMNVAVESDDGNPRLRELARNAISAWQQRLMTILREGLHAGEIRPGVNPRRVANTIIATLEGAQIMSRLAGDRQPLRDAQVSLNFLLDSIAGTPRLTA